MTPGRTRDVAVDTAMAVIALAVGLTSDQNLLYGRSDRPGALAVADLVLGAGCIAGIWVWRRRFPVAFALVAIAVGVVSTVGGGVALICVFTVAELRPWRIAVPISVLAAASIVPALAIYPVPHEARSITIGVLATFAATGWGMYLRARHELLASLRRQLDDAERAASARAAAARRGERERIAREMHDVLAHRLSLLAVHAGALEYNQAASPEEVTRAVGIIRSNTHEALDELRQVISLLRDRQPDDVRPQPTLADLPALIEESRAAGLVVSYTVPERPRSETPCGRTAYRVVQEALTNTRKHAPRAHVEVAVRESLDGLEVFICNDIPRVTRPPDAPPGSGTGLMGLRERVNLAGGRIEYGPLPDGQFRVWAWLPDSALSRVPS
jgi:signal transduction histidine kinase